MPKVHTIFAPASNQIIHSTSEISTRSALYPTCSANVDILPSIWYFANNLSDTVSDLSDTVSA